MTSTAPSPAEAESPVRRFSRAERAVHRLTGVLMTICLLTAAILYNGSISSRIGHRYLVENIHVYCGFALLVPLLIGLASATLRLDVRRLGRFAPSDWAWLRSRTRRDGTIRVGKFNAGQKLNGSLTLGSILVLLGSGVVMYFVGLAPLPWRSGATFVHDWFALALGLLVVGHVTFALKDPEARRGMRTGSVSRTWAATEHARWLAEVEHEGPGSEGAGRTAAESPQ